MTIWANFAYAFFIHFYLNRLFQSIVGYRYFKVSKVVWCKCFGLSNWAWMYLFWPFYSSVSVLASFEKIGHTAPTPTTTKHLPRTPAYFDETKFIELPSWDHCYNTFHSCNLQPFYINYRGNIVLQFNTEWKKCRKIRIYQLPVSATR